MLTNSFAGRLLRRARGERPPEPEELIEQQHRREHDHGGIRAAEQPTEPEPAAPPPAALAVARLRAPMHCGHCAGRIEDRLGALPGVHRVSADHEADVVEIGHTAEVFEGQIRAKLHEMGFDVQGYADEQEAPA